MTAQNAQFDKHHGAALILVVVVTVLLAVIGVMFLMVSRLSEMETTSVADQRDLDAAVQTVVSRIDEVLVEDLFGGDETMADGDGSDEPYDAPGPEDPWLATLEPDASMGVRWTPITDLYDWRTVLPGWTNLVVPRVVPASEAVIFNESGGSEADADGDGIADSRWAKIPNLTGSRGRDMYAAVRIIDNGAMLNLNTAFGFYPNPTDTAPWFAKRWYVSANDDPTNRSPYAYDGRTLAEINFTPFLRSYDVGRPERIQLFRDGYARQAAADPMNPSYFGQYTAGPMDFHQQHVMRLEEPMQTISGTQMPLFRAFDIGDELEIRNRYLLTGQTVANFEKRDPDEERDRDAYPPFMALDAEETYDGVAYETFDLGRGTGVPGMDNWNSDWNAKVNSVPFEEIDKWRQKLDPYNFDNSDPDNDLAFEYDRRHLCTFYSYDRPLRRGTYPLLRADLAALGYTAEQLEKIEPVFIPKGAVATDISVSVDIEVSPGLWERTSFNSVQTRRKILHLLFALREHYYQENGGDLRQAALSAAQVTANLIDYADDNAIHPATTDKQGPFHDAVYYDQANVDCTFIREDMIQAMIQEVSDGGIPAGTVAFGLNETDVVFGYERQPFISEVYANRDPEDGTLLGFGIELVNPYANDMRLYRNDAAYNQEEDVWRIRVGDGTAIDAPIWSMFKVVPRYNITNNSPGRYVIRSSTFVSTASGPLVPATFELADLLGIDTLADREIQLLRPAPANSGVDFIVVDRVPSERVNELWTGNDPEADEDQNAIKRQDTDWKFVYGTDDYYVLQQSINGTYTHTLGQANGVTTGADTYEPFQLAVADDGYGVSRPHDLAVLSQYGSGAEDTDPNVVLTARLSTAAGIDPNALHFDMTAGGVTDYLCTLNRPDKGTLPGRININTAPLHVLAAAIPPALADPNALDPDETVTYSALDMAQAIIDNRPYTAVSDLLKISSFRQYAAGGAWADTNVGSPSIRNDIEERQWVYSHLANKFTVRSDVFTAYILVRLGQDGPQRRMIAIFDRSAVWTPDDRPKLVALHPVPDPR